MRRADADDLDAVARLLLEAGAALPAVRVRASLGGWSAARLDAALAGLRTLGAPLRRTDAGIALGPIDRLDAVALATQARAIALDVCAVCRSTNDRVRALAPPAACLAEAQLAGRGRRGSAWLQPFGSGLVLSLSFPASGLAAGLAIALAVAAADALAGLGYRGIGLKWPNDLYFAGRKLGGLLVEAEGGPDARTVVGIGLNVHDAPAIAGRATAALSEWGPAPRRTAIAARLLPALCAAYEQFAGAGLAAFAPGFARRDVLAGREITVRARGMEVSGRARGLAQDGTLLVDTVRGPRRFAAGEVSLGAWPNA